MPRNEIYLGGGGIESSARVAFTKQWRSHSFTRYRVCTGPATVQVLGLELGTRRAPCSHRAYILMWESDDKLLGSGVGVNRGVDSPGTGGQGSLGNGG